MNPLVSVVIPTYNRAPELARALDSVRRQTFPQWEALVVDNHSQDDTIRVVESLADARICLLSIRNEGVIAASRNMGIRHAKGRYVAFLDSDDAWHPEKLVQSLNRLEHGHDVVYHDMDIWMKGWAPMAQKVYKTRLLSNPVFRDLLVNGNGLPTSSVVVRRELLEKANGFREDTGIIAGEDYDLWLRLSLLTERFGQVHGRLGILTRNGDGEFSPARLISIIAEIEQRYLHQLSIDEISRARSNWIDYALARARYNLGEYGSARLGLLHVLATSENWLFKLKSIVMLLAMTARSGGSRGS
jgi:glycosyltransferase involved in cell wall biosynthesis